MDCAFLIVQVIVFFLIRLTTACCRSWRGARRETEVVSKTARLLERLREHLYLRTSFSLN